MKFNANKLIIYAASDSSGLVSETDSFRLGYRGDIEGLRALGILLVIAAHAGISWFKGGFVGVDVFFVLSGYLITGLLVQEIRTTGKLRLLNFFARRLKRLLPALLFMVITISLVGAMLLAPLEQSEQATSARAASAWVSNIYFAFSNFDYFNAAAEKSLFLHTWSLGVEEQFYLIWPLLLMFLLGAWRWQGAKQNYSRLFFGMAAIFGICLLFSVFLSHTMPLWGFYLMPSRAWQFALGALALLWSVNGHNGITNRSVSHRTFKIIAVGGWLGLILILSSAFLLNSNTSYPGILALMPSVGAALVLISGSTITPTSASRALSIWPMQWTGRVSYSWYLWHWPILLLGGTFFKETEPFGSGLLVALSLALAIFSYLAVESPIRNSRRLSVQPGLTLAASLVLMAATFTLTTGWQRATVSWAQLPEQKNYTKVRSEVLVLYTMGCDEWIYSARLRVCKFGPNDAKHTAVLIGDSIAAQWFPAIASIYNKPGWRLLVLTKSSCPMVDEPFFYPRLGREFTECAVWRNAALGWIKSLRPDVVFMGTTRASFSQSQWVSGTVRVLGKFAREIPSVFIISPTYGLPFDGPACLSRQRWQKKFFRVDTDCSAQVDSQQENNIYTWLTQAAKVFNNVSVIDMNSIVCPDNRCYAERDGKIIYRDNQHLSASYVLTLIDAFLQKLK